MNRQSTRRLAGVAFLVPVLAIVSMSASSDTETTTPQRNRYIGVKACKNCHNVEAKGGQYKIWAKGPHANAFKVLASDAAKAIAKKRGIPDAQKSPKCLKCHETAYGAKRTELKRNFKHELGVQCETCHGPGERHFKKRFAAATAGKIDEKKYQPTSPGEIIAKPPVKTCLGCHNEESPSFKPFCFREREKIIRHFDPRHKRSAEELEAMKCKCGDCKCKQAECGSYTPAKAKGEAPVKK